jgi:hypothetical protein
MAAAVALAGCASHSSSIKPTYVSAATYDNWDCKKLTDEQQRIHTELAKVSSDQDANADADAAMVGVGAVLLWPVLFGLAATNDYEDQIAQLKGYKAAIDQQVTARCS